VKSLFGQRLVVPLDRESKKLSDGQEFEGLDDHDRGQRIFTTLTGGQGVRHRLDEASRLLQSISSPLYLFMVKLLSVRLLFDRELAVVRAQAMRKGKR
jgi:hypothetical protein